MSKRHPDDNGGGYDTPPHTKVVAASIVLIGVSITAIIIAWATIGYQGSSFSINVMQDQQKRLREMYGLPPEPELGPEQFEVPHLLRKFTGSGTSVAGEANNSTSNSTKDVRPA